MRILEHEPLTQPDGRTPLVDPRGRVICACGIHIDLAQFERHAAQMHYQQMLDAQYKNNNLAERTV